MANRSMSSAMLTEIAKTQTTMVHFVSIGFDSGTLYYCTHVRDLTWNSHTWSASHDILDISDITEDTELRINTATVTLSAVDQSHISSALTEDYTDRPLNIYLGFLNSSNAVIADPVPIFPGRIDSWSSNEDPASGSSKITWTASNHFADFDRVQGRLANDESQQLLFSGDKFFEFTSEIPRSITWGRETQTIIAPSNNNIARPGTSTIRGFAFSSAEGDWITQIGISTDIADTIASIPVIYGTRQITGIRSFVGVSENNGKHLYLVYTLCEGQINDVTSCTLDGTEYTQFKDPDSTSSPKTALVSLTVHSGTDSQSADSNLVTDFTGWTSAHQGKGVAYAVLRLTYHPDVFSSIPNEVKFIVQGKLVTDITASPQTSGFSNNPALCLYDYLTDSRYGKGLSASNLSGFAAAVTTCDTLYNPTGASPAVTQAQFTCDAVVDTSDTLLNNTKKLLGTMRGMLPYTGGVYNLIIDQDESAVFTFTEDNIAGSWNFKVEGIRNRYNRVEASFINPNRSWKKDIGAVESSTYQTNDNGRILKLQFDMPYTTNLYRAQDQAEFIMNQSRQQIRTGFKANLSAFKIEPGNVIDITHTTPGWTTKTFRVKSIVLHNDGDQTYTLTEHDSNVYTMSARSAAANAPDTNLPDPSTVIAPSGLSLASGESYLVQGTDGSIISRIRASWTASTDAYGRYYEIQYKKSSASPAIWTDAPDVLGVDSTEGYAAGVVDGVDYDVRVRLINVRGIASSWVTSSNHTVVGKTSPPDDVTGFIAAQNGDTAIFKWNQVSNIDRDGYEIRYGPRGNTSWEDATPLTRITRGTNITTSDLPPGDWTCYIEAVDTSGNYSTNPASDDLNFVNTHDVITSVSQATSWSGTISNFVKTHRGVLVPDSQNLASADGFDTFNTFVINPYATCTYEAAEIDIGFDDTVRIWADITSALGPGETGIANPQLSIDYKLAAGSYDGFEDWSIGNREARYFKFKLTLTTADGIAYISAFTPTIDNQEDTQSANSVAVAVSGTTITFSPQFHLTPFVKVQAVGTSARTAMADSVTTTGFTAYVFNSSGTDVGGTINWEAKGV